MKLDRIVSLRGGLNQSQRDFRISGKLLVESMKGSLKKESLDVGQINRYLYLFTTVALTTILAFKSPGYIHDAVAQDQVLDETAASAPNTEIHVNNADLGAIIKIFSKKTKRNYILDERVKGKITINLPGKVSDSESIRILDAILALKGFTAVPIGENLWKVIPIKDARRTTIPTVFDESDSLVSATVVTRVIRLKYVNADDMQKLISQLVSAEGLVNAYSRTNSLLLVDSHDNIARIIEIVNAVDIPSSDRDMTIVPVKNADASEIVATLSEILGDPNNTSGSSIDPSGGIDNRLEAIRNRIREAASRRAEGSTQITDGSVPGSENVSIAAAGEPPKMVADQRTNSIIIVADETETARIRALIFQLDSEIDLSGNRFYVYRCQHANAEELASVLSGLAGGGSSSPSGSESLLNTSTGLSRVNDSARSQRGNAANRTQDRLLNQRRTPGRSRSETSGIGGSTIGGGLANFGEDLSITADPATNSLIIAASKTDYEKIKELLKQLDIKRRQVLVEALLLEVQVDDSQSLGTEFLGSTGGTDGGVLATLGSGGLQQLLQDPTSLSNFSIAAASSGTLTLPGNITIPTQTVLVTAAMSNRNVNVLSAPTILATDNEPAEIVIGQNVPFLASTSTSGDNLNNTFNQIDRQDVGITLRLTPQISSGDFIKLQLFTEVSDLQQDTANSGLGPSTTIRTTETTVIVKDQQMVAIGGLMADAKSEGSSGIPFLKDIPLIGYAFKTTSKTGRRNNLLIFITPKLIRDQYDLRDATLASREPLREIIVDNNIKPSREDVLSHFNMDRVAEAKNDALVKSPGTIRPPQGAPVPLGSLNSQRWSENNAPSSPSSAVDGQTIELRVAPNKTGESSNRSTSLTPSKKSNNENDEALVGSSGTYLVLQPLSPASSSMIEKGPFPSIGRSSSVGILLPPESSDIAKRFFNIGSSYRYKLGDEEWPMKLIGKFSSGAEAKNSFPTVPDSWHILSPYEIINLGSGPWFRD